MEVKLNIKLNFVLKTEFPIFWQCYNCNDHGVTEKGNDYRIISPTMNVMTCADAARWAGSGARRPSRRRACRRSRASTTAAWSPWTTCLISSPLSIVCIAFFFIYI